MPEQLVPADLGLPPKFAAYRRDQLEIALEIASSRKRFNKLSAPTGTGKSLIAMTVVKALGARALYVVGTKGLQQQLMDDFKTAGMVDMRGQSNYRCVALDRELKDYGRPGSMCNDGPCRVGVYCPLRQDGGCFYYDAQEIASKSEIVVTNYAYWLAMGRHSDPDSLGKFDLLILDEAHTAPDWLSDFCSVELDRDEIKTLLGLSLPPTNEGVTVWAEWARNAADIARDRYVTTRADLDGNRNDRRAATRRLLRLVDISRDLTELARAHSWRRSDPPQRDIRMPGLHTDWVIEPIPRGVKFSPVWAHAYAEQYLFRGIPKVILTSATLSKSLSKYLGIHPNHSDYFEVKSGFDPTRRPFIYIPTTRVDRNMLEGQVRLWVNRVDKIIGSRLDRKGVIHTRSYDRMKALLGRSKFKHLFITHDSRTTRDAVSKFRRSPAPCVLVSPSIEEGFDFPDDLCRYQIVAKIPFIDGRNPITKERQRTDKGYSNYVAAISLIQMYGRGMRSSDDWCETFIIDDHWLWFRRIGIFPKWFRQAWRSYDVIPPPIGTISDRKLASRVSA